MPIAGAFASRSLPSKTQHATRTSAAKGGALVASNQQAEGLAERVIKLDEIKRVTVCVEYKDGEKVQHVILASKLYETLLKLLAALL